MHTCSHRGREHLSVHTCLQREREYLSVYTCLQRWKEHLAVYTFSQIGIEHQVYTPTPREEENTWMCTPVPREEENTCEHTCPQRRREYLSVHTCPQRGREHLAVYTCPQRGREHLSVNTCPQRGRKHLSVNTCPQRGRKHLAVNTCPQRGREHLAVYTSPQRWREHLSVLTCSQKGREHLLPWRITFRLLALRNSEAASTMIPWAWRLLPRNTTRSLSTSSTNQRAEDHHRQLEAYGYFLPIQTRWQDNDQYGHVNNTVYYSYFDTIINHYLIRCCGLETNLLTSPLVGFMVTNQCKYHTPISFPQIPVAALAVEKVGRSSVCYRLALFPPKPSKELPPVDHRDLTDGFFLGHAKLAHFDTLACTTGSSVHVFVNPATGKPESLPEGFRRGLQKLLSPA